MERKRDFLFAEDCCEGLKKIYLNYNKIKIEKICRFNHR